MSEVPITISGVLYDKLNRTSTPVTLEGLASKTVGGGPIIPSDPPLEIWGPNDPRPTPPIHIPDPGFGLKPEHPIVLPPNVPTHPIVIPPDNPGEPPDLILWPPYVDNTLPMPQPPFGECHKLVYSLRYGWALAHIPSKK